MIYNVPNGDLVKEIKEDLTADNNQSFRFGYDDDTQKYGYWVKEADTDVFRPFSQGATQNIEIEHVAHGVSISKSRNLAYTVAEEGYYMVMSFATTTVTTNITPTDKIISSINLSTRGKFNILYCNIGDEIKVSVISVSSASFDAIISKLIIKSLSDFTFSNLDYFTQSSMSLYQELSKEGNIDIAIGNIPNNASFGLIESVDSSTYESKNLNSYTIFDKNISMDSNNIIIEVVENNLSMNSMAYSSGNSDKKKIISFSIVATED